RDVVDRFDGEGVAGAVDEGGGAEGARPAAGAAGVDVVGAGGGEVAGGVGAVPAGVGAAVLLDRELDGGDGGAGVAGGAGEGAVPAAGVVVAAGRGEADRRRRSGGVVDEAGAGGGGVGVGVGGVVDR